MIVRVNLACAARTPFVKHDLGHGFGVGFLLLFLFFHFFNTWQNNPGGV